MDRDGIPNEVKWGYGHNGIFQYSASCIDELSFAETYWLLNT